MQEKLPRTDLEVDAQAIALVPVHLALRTRMLPLRVVSNDGSDRLVVCTWQTPDAPQLVGANVDKLQRELKLTVMCEFADAAAVQAKLVEAYNLMEIDERAAARLDRDFSLANHVVPVRTINADGKELLLVAMRNPDDHAMIDQIQRRGRAPVIGFAIDKHDLLTLQHRAYRLGTPARAIASVVPLGGPMALRIQNIIREAIRIGEADVHFEAVPPALRGQFADSPDPKLREHFGSGVGGHVRIETHDELDVIEVVSVDDYRTMIGTLATMASMDQTNDGVDNVGRYAMDVDGRAVNVRIAMGPTADSGVQAVLRLHDTARAPKTIAQLGANPEIIAAIEADARSVGGIRAITGPPGSGKNTLQVAMIVLFDPSRNKVCTAEKSIEHWLPYVQHEEISPLRSAKAIVAQHLQKNARLIVVSEVLEEGMAATVDQVGNYGGGFIKTMHCNSSIAGIARARSLGVSLGTIANSYTMIVAARIVHVPCKECGSEIRTPDAFRRRRTDAPAKLWVMNRAGCDYCNRGKVSKTGAFEVLRFNDELREAIWREARNQEIEAIALRSGLGYRPLLEDALDKVCSGSATLLDVAERVGWSLDRELDETHGILKAEERRLNDVAIASRALAGGSRS